MKFKEGATPLYMASHNGHRDVVKTLIRNGANPTKTFKVAPYGLTVTGCSQYHCIHTGVEAS